MSSVIRLLLFITFLLPLGCIHFSPAQQSVTVGSIHGRVVDAAGAASLPGANILLLNSSLGTAADAEGRYKLANVPVGTWSLRVTFMGYEAAVITDVVVRPGRITFVDVRLASTAYETEEVEVTAGYFRKRESEAVSMAGFSGEEIRRSPGSAGDVSRIMMVLPSVAKVNDQSNSLIVRGGSPLENAFFIDGIEIPNINHFPAQGSSGGPLGMLPVDMIGDVSFMAGGFPARFGDKLSAVMDITLRDGNREATDAQLDLNFAGFGAQLEGPLGSGSYLLSARRSYLDLLVKAVNVGSTVAPWYGDAHAKIVLNPSAAHRLSVLAQFSDDHNDPDAQAAVDNDMQYYGPQDIYNGTLGMSWRAMWSESVYSASTLSYTGMWFRERFRKTGSNEDVFSNNSRESWLSLRSSTHIRLGASASLEAGFDAKGLWNSYENRYASIPDALGVPQPERLFAEDVSSTLLGLHASMSITPAAPLSVTLGLRADHSTWNSSTELSPRVSASYRVGAATTLSASAGMYTQNLPLLLLAQDRSNEKLRNPRSTQAVLGISQLLTESTMLTVEGYYKKGERFPIDPAQPALFLVDELSYRYGFFTGHGPLTDAGTSRSYGGEVILQKKLARDVYGLASASLSRSEYTGANGATYARVYDNRIQFNIEGGYKIDENWEVSLRWIFAGGVPYTPFDIEASRANDTEVLDVARINSERHPDYHSMNVRVDHRFHFAASNLVLYLSVWNAYNRKNVAAYIWDTVNKQPKRLYQWGVLPIIGVEYEL
jgi:hypothetical protein